MAGWVDRKLTSGYVYPLGVQLSDILPLCEGFKLPNKIPEILLEVKANSTLAVISVRSFPREEYFTIWPEVKKVWDVVEKQSQTVAVPNCPGFILPVFRCGGMIRTCPLTINRHARALNSSEYQRAKIPVDWVATLNKN